MELTFNSQVFYVIQETRTYAAAWEARNGKKARKRRWEYESMSSRKDWMNISYCVSSTCK